MKTKQLNDGTVVLAHGSAVYGISAYTYANRTQAQRAAIRVGGEVIQRGRPFYVRINIVAEPSAAEQEEMGLNVCAEASNV